APDVGGGFGSKLNVYAEEMLVVALARRLGVPVKWTEERSEGYLATIHGRDQWQEIELAASSEGKISAVRVRLTAAMGAYLQLVTAGIPLLGAWLYAGCYDVEAYSLECTGVFTHTTPTDAYRGAGRPEATYAIERAVDQLARQLGKDPVEVRRLNFIREFPNTIASGLTIDSGDYDADLARELEMLDLEEMRRGQAERRARGEMKVMRYSHTAVKLHEVDQSDLEYEACSFCVRGTDRALTLKEIAFGAWTAHNLPEGMEPGLEASYVYDPPNFSWPAGTHVAVV